MELEMDCHRSRKLTRATTAKIARSGTIKQLPPPPRTGGVSFLEEVWYKNDGGSHERER